MYESKRNGRNTFRPYIAGMSLYTIERLSIETDLRKALDRREFELYYQPQVCLLSGKIASNEALIKYIQTWLTFSNSLY